MSNLPSWKYYYEYSVLFLYFIHQLLLTFSLYDYYHNGYIKSIYFIILLFIIINISSNIFYRLDSRKLYLYIILVPIHILITPILLYYDYYNHVKFEHFLLYYFDLTLTHAQEPKNYDFIKKCNKN